MPAKLATKKAPVRKPAKPPAERPQNRNDRWVNFLTAIGDVNRDKTQGATFELENVPENEAEDIWRGDDMGAKIIDKPIEEMFRQGYHINFGGDLQNKEEIERALASQMSDLKVNASLKTAMKYSRAYGGGAVLIGVNDGQADLTKPLNLDSVRSVQYLTVLRPRELYPQSWYTDPAKPNYGDPEVFSIVPDTVARASQQAKIRSGSQIHESRFILFRGVVVSRRHLRENNGWGDSVLVRLLNILAQFHQVWGGSANLLADFSQAVLKIKGLAELLSGNGRAKVMDRAIAIDMSRSIARSVILDSEEGWERQATPMSGYPEMLDKWMLRLAAAVDMPVSMLFGQSPSGLQATGDADIRFFYDCIAAKQDEVLRPALEKIIGILLRAKGNPVGIVTGGIEPSTWGVDFNSLWQTTKKEQAETHKAQAEADALMIEKQVTTPEEIAMSRFGGEGYSLDTKLDLKTRENYAKALAGAPETTNQAPEEGSPKAGLLTPTDVATIVSVNQALEWLGFGPKKLPSGADDPDGSLTVAQYQAKNAGTVAAAASATAGESAVPSTDRRDAMTWFMSGELKRRAA